MALPNFGFGEQPAFLEHASDASEFIKAFVGSMLIHFKEAYFVKAIKYFCRDRKMGRVDHFRPIPFEFPFGTL